MLISEMSNTPQRLTALAQARAAFERAAADANADPLDILCARAAYLDEVYREIERTNP